MVAPCWKSLTRVLTGPLLALVVVQLAFATLAVAGKFVLLAGLPPLTLAGLRVLFSALVLSTAVVSHAHERVAARDLWTLAGLSLLGVVFNQLLFIEGLARTTAIDAGILIVTIPVFTLVIATLLRHEHFNRSRAAGVLVAFVGALVLLRVEDFRLSDDVILGNLFILLNCLSYSFYLVLSRRILRRYRSGTVVAWTFLLGALVMTPLGMPDLVRVLPQHVFTAKVLVALVWIVVVGTGLAYALNTYALKRLPASTVAGFIFLQPLAIVVLALLFLPGERLEPRTLVAALLTISGVLQLARASPVVRVPEPASP